MNVSTAILKRRAFRNMIPTDIDEEMIKQLLDAVRLSPSCFNNQPWRYTFVYNRDKLQELHAAYSEGNEWAHKASLAIVAYSKKDLDCVIRDRIYYLFDTGISAGFLMLKATELGLIAHPSAGVRPRKVKKILDIPNDMDVIAMILVGTHDDSIAEKERPQRKSLEEIATII